MMEKNLSHEMIVLDPDYDNLEGYEYYDVSYDNEDGSVTHCRYAKEKDKLGIVPEILNTLLNERSNAKKEMKNETNPFKKSLLNGKQLALKVTANSLYGQIGAATSA